MSRVRKASKRFTFLVNQALDYAMQRTGKTQEQVAKAMGVNKNTLTGWRQGGIPAITEEYFDGALYENPYAVSYKEIKKAVVEVQKLQELINKTIDDLVKQQQELSERIANDYVLHNSGESGNEEKLK